MNIFSWFLSSWPRMGLDEPADIESWRDWFGKVIIIFFVIGFPMAMLATFPILIADKKYLLLALDLGIWLFLVSRLFVKSTSYKINAFIFFAVLYTMMISFFIELGPVHARPIWLVLCSVMAALMFGVRGAVLSTAVNAIILIILYWLMGPENKAWAAEYSTSYRRWIMFITNASVITLASSLPVGFMLNKLNQSLEGERNIHEKLLFESDKLKSANQTLHDEIEQRKKAENALRMSEEKYRFLIENIPSVTWITDEHGKTSFISPNVQKIYGFDQKEICERGDEIWFGRIHPDDADQVRSSFGTMFTRKQGFDLEYRIKNKAGEWLWLHDTGVMAIEREGTRYAYGVFSDVTKRKQAEASLRESEERFKLLFEHAPDAYYLIDKEGVFVDGNRMSETLSGYDKNELIGKKFFETGLLSADQIPIAMKTFAKNAQGLEAGPEELSLTQKRGNTVYIEIRSYPINIKNQLMILGIARDITERKQTERTRRELETRLVQAQKMEAIGTLAGGIAHDFNNILSAIMGYTELATLDSRNENKVEHHLQHVLDGANRAKALVQQILTFSRQSEQDLRPIYLNPIIKEAIKLLRASLPSNIEIRSDIRDEAQTVHADPTQIHQIVMNLCANAGHAMRERGGLLEVILEKVVIDSEHGQEYEDINPGSYLKLTVSDTGHGMTPEIVKRIFDPYFTTKDKEEGTGLGLAVVHGIITTHGGMISVQSEPGKGSKFQIFFPSLEKKIDPEREVVKFLPTGTERILFIDDEEVLVDLGRDMLEKLGYSVVSRTNSLEALELFKNKPDQFDLVITDMTMPQMTGDTLARKMKTIRPDIPIILCTGFSHQINEDKAKGMGISDFLMKPLVIGILAKSIRKVLDQ